MTQYFDDFQREVDSFDRSVGFPSTTEADRVRELEHRLVFDCTVTAQAPEFPANLREAIHQTILRGAVHCQPMNTPPDLVADFEVFSEHLDRLSRLGSDLHSIFHEVARDESCPFYDNPRAWVLMKASEGEEVRERMAAELAGTTLEAQISGILGNDGDPKP
jgi:hypothetical protein